jgi:hypothetical protein
MDIVEFAENYYGAKLPEWQKDYLRTLDDMCKDGNVRIVMPKDHGRFYTYFKFKELFPDGPQNDRE